MSEIQLTNFIDLSKISLTGVYCDISVVLLWEETRLSGEIPPVRSGDNQPQLLPLSKQEKYTRQYCLLISIQNNTERPALIIS